MADEPRTTPDHAVPDVVLEELLAAFSEQDAEAMEAREAEILAGLGVSNPYI